ncbi:efflux RND transporter permease subunit [Sessilibacter corallicola]|uniref:efflux RND transporter permease subunit n=1 Tax=Sessilibacter corallicola TaxID=2904075 RepID=UPI001E3AAFB0|nr:MMPL family transporter [Sessilibacter corallicola]MCE2027236.1 MMPL family transporter [Sessilibacter corallicola]
MINTDALCHFFINNRKWVFWVLLAVVATAAIQFPKIQTDTDPENMLPTTDLDRQYHNQVKETFALHDSLVIGIVNPDSIYHPKTLAKLVKVTEFIDGLDSVVHQDILSLATVDNISQKEPGTIQFEWMMKTPPQSDERAQQIRSQVSRLPFLRNTIVSIDEKAATIYVPLIDKNTSFKTANEIRRYIDSLESDSLDNDQWHITGLPVAEDQFGHEMFVQMGISAPLAGLVIFILLWVFFRNIPFITAPMIIAMATVIITMGTLIAFGFTVHIMSSMIAIFLMPIAVVDSVHFLSEFSDNYKKDSDVKEVLSEVVGRLFQPMLFTSITSSIGFYSLLLTPIPPVQIFGAFVGTGILLAFALTIIFLPAYISQLNSKNLEKLIEINPDSEDSKIAGSVRRFGQIANSNTKIWYLVFIAISGISAYGISKIEINDNPVRWFKPDHQIRIADQVLNHHFAGTYDAYIVLEQPKNHTQALINITSDFESKHTLQSEFKNILDEFVNNLEKPDSNLTSTVDDTLFALEDFSFLDISEEQLKLSQDFALQLEEFLENTKPFLNPSNLSYIADLQEYLNTTGLVGKSNSLSDIVKTVNRELHSGSSEDFRLPNSNPAVAQTLLQYQSSHRPQDLWHFVTRDYSQSLVWLQLTSGDNKDMQQVINKVDEYIAANPLPAGMDYHWAGKAYLNLIWQEKMVAGMFDSLSGAFILVFLIMALLFRSFVFGAVAMLPLSLSIAFIYGIIGIIGKDYDMPIAVLSALTLGISVDFAIHFIERLRVNYRQLDNWNLAIKAMFEEPGRAITRNAIVIAIGFTPLLFAPLVPYITVGVLLASIMAISAVATLIMIPSVLKPFHKRVFN